MDMPTKTSKKKPLLTRKTGAELITKTFGFPFPVSRFEKDAMQDDDRPAKAPKPVAIYGRTHLYTEEQILAYGQSLIRPASKVQERAA